MNSHVTKLDEDLDPMKGTHYQPRCTCGWTGAKTFDLARAKTAARIHRMCTTVKAT